jgi:hypothetical protein
MDVTEITMWIILTLAVVALIVWNEEDNDDLNKYM